MIFVYSLELGSVKRTIQKHKEPLPENIIWLDLYNITPEEEKIVENFLQINIPTREEMKEIEHSSRLYERYGAVYMTAILVAKSDSAEPQSEPVTFILFNNLFITVRYSEFKAFKNNGINLVKFKNEYCSSIAIYSELLKNIIESIADRLEKLRNDIDESAKTIFNSRNSNGVSEKVDYQILLQSIGKKGILISKIRESLVAINRMVLYSQQTRFSEEQDLHEINVLKAIITDVQALNEYANFLSIELNFVLDATLGMVNIEQNNIIKIFSVVSVVFLPPTLIASIYGMNFKLIPELSWPVGYPFAICLMLLSAWLPYRYFKKRKWL